MLVCLIGWVIPRHQIVWKPVECRLKANDKKCHQRDAGEQFVILNDDAGHTHAYIECTSAHASHTY